MLVKILWNFTVTAMTCLKLPPTSHSLITVVYRLSSRDDLIRTPRVMLISNRSLSFAVGATRIHPLYTDNRLNCDTIIYEENIQFALGADPARSIPDFCGSGSIPGERSKTRS